MKSLYIKIIVLCLVFFLYSPFSFAWSKFTETTDDFQIDFPCEPVTRHVNFNTFIIKTYACEESIGSDLILYQVNSSGNSNGNPIRYKERDINFALKSYIINNFKAYGINQENIEFHVIPRFMDEFPAIYYYINDLSKGIIAEGISCLVRGKHYKIGVMYELPCQDVAKKKLKYFLNSCKLN